MHRDVSPQNVLVGVDGATRITDFGVAHAIERMTKTVGQRVKGKLAYCSPEQAKALPLDRRSDVFALGVVLWETLTLRRLFHHPSPVELVRALLHAPIDDPRHLRPEIPEPLSLVVMRALQRDPADRFASALEMAEALRATGLAAPAKEVRGVVEHLAGNPVRTLIGRIREAVQNSTVRPSIAPPGAAPAKTELIAHKTMAALAMEVLSTGDNGRPFGEMAALDHVPARTQMLRQQNAPGATVSMRPSKAPQAPPAHAPQPAHPASSPLANASHPTAKTAPGAFGRQQLLWLAGGVMGTLLAAIAFWGVVTAFGDEPNAESMAVDTNAPSTIKPPAIADDFKPPVPVSPAAAMPGAPAAVPAVPAQPTASPTPTARSRASAAGALCDNSCFSANDGECDDGGPNSLFDVCGLGTDCADCGPRGAIRPTGACTNTCAHANDGECDDGGGGSRYSLCTLGTDCNDCGRR